MSISATQPHPLCVLLPQVALYLKDSWIQTLKNSLRSCLLHVGRGWYNLREKNYHTYKMSQMCRIMDTVRFIMQVWGVSVYS